MHETIECLKNLSALWGWGVEGREGGLSYMTFICLAAQDCIKEALHGLMSLRGMDGLHNCQLYLSPLKGELCVKLF